MSGRRASPVWRAPLIAWAALLALLVVTVVAAFLPLGPFKLGVSLGIAAAKALVIAIVFMRLNSASPLIRLAAGAALVWLTLMFVLTGADYLSRP